jgi:D-alanyl-D-alanine carboxypeptidase/D-alanyl-D-alanine-endopeptidase (penicillin-binding protein 4)
MFVRWCVMVLVVGVVTSLACAQDRLSRQLQADLTKIVREYEAKSGATVAVCVRDSRSGEIFAGLKSNRLMSPASNLKLLTSAVAIEELGEDYEFTTRVYLDGQDVIVVGGFDPTLGDPRLAEATKRTIYSRIDKWVDAAKRELDGQPVGDIVLVCPGSTSEWRNPDWKPSQFTFWYAAPAASLNFNDNCIDVTFDVADEKVAPALSPASQFIEVKNDAKVGSRHRWGVRPTKDLSEVTVFGTVTQSTDEPLSVAIDNPPMLLGRVLADRFVKAGVSVDGEIRVVEDAADRLGNAKEVATTETPIKHVLWRVNKHSLNMAAECLLLRVGDGTWDGGLDAMSETLIDDFGIDADEFVLEDGSGLAAGNKVTTAAMTKVLAQAVKSDGGTLLAASLPKSGAKGGKLEKRMADSTCKGRVLGKTGYIVGTQALSGFILDSSNRPAVTYSILINEVPGGEGGVAKGTQDAICKLLVEYIDSREAEKEAGESAD